MSVVIAWLMQHPIAIALESLIAHLLIVWLLGSKMLTWYKQRKRKRATNDKVAKSKNTSSPNTPKGFSIFNALVILAIVALLSWGGVSVIALNSPTSSNVTVSASVDVKKAVIKLVMQKSSGEHYKISDSPYPEMVKGSVGRYFYVNLVTPEVKQDTFFPKKKYSLEQSEVYLTDALNEFHSKVMGRALQAGAKIYIRGGADGKIAEWSEKFIKVSCGGEAFSDIYYFPGLSKNEGRDADRRVRYENQLVSKYLTQKMWGFFQKNSSATPMSYGNDDLPELRSRYVQCKYKELFPKDQTYLLQGSASEALNDELRKATLILYIPD